MGNLISIALLDVKAQTCSEVVAIGDLLVPGAVGMPDPLRYNTEQRSMC